MVMMKKTTAIVAAAAVMNISGVACAPPATEQTQVHLAPVADEPSMAGKPAMSRRSSWLPWSSRADVAAAEEEKKRQESLKREREQFEKDGDRAIKEVALLKHQIQQADTLIKQHKENQNTFQARAQTEDGLMNLLFDNVYIPKKREQCERNIRAKILLDERVIQTKQEEMELWGKERDAIEEEYDTYAKATKSRSHQHTAGTRTTKMGDLLNRVQAANQKFDDLQEYVKEASRKQSELKKRLSPVNMASGKAQIEIKNAAIKGYYFKNNIQYGSKLHDWIFDETVQSIKSTEIMKDVMAPTLEVLELLDTNIGSDVSPYYNGMPLIGTHLEQKWKPVVGELKRDVETAAERIDAWIDEQLVNAEKERRIQKEKESMSAINESYCFFGQEKILGTCEASDPECQSQTADLI